SFRLNAQMLIQSIQFHQQVLSCLHLVSLNSQQLIQQAPKNFNQLHDACGDQGHSDPLRITGRQKHRNRFGPRPHVS
ncbi:MAG: hypothetical protein ACK5FF_01600, partial [Planctomyces sp.]